MLFPFKVRRYFFRMGIKVYLNKKNTKGKGQIPKTDILPFVICLLLFK